MAISLLVAGAVVIMRGSWGGGSGGGKGLVGASSEDILVS